MESVCSGFVPAPNKSDSAEAAEVMVRSLVPLWHKSGTAVRCLLPLPWLSLCPMPWLSVTGRTRLQSEQDEKEHRKRKIFFSWISSGPGSVIWLHKLQCRWRGRGCQLPKEPQNNKSKDLCWRTCFADSFQTCISCFYFVWFLFLFCSVYSFILTHPPVHCWANSLSFMTCTVSVRH